MGTSDGTVQGLTTLVSNGPDAERHNIVLVAEGFTESEQSDFNDRCDDVVGKIQSEAWFAELGAAINIHRLNVASDESGTDDPATCPDGNTGAGTTAATYFDSGFCNAGIRRCLSGNEGLVRSTLDVQLPGWDSAAVLVNATERGGCASGNVFWASLSSDFREVVVHELGHASFDLADEYSTWAGCTSGETDRDNAPSNEPDDVNITTETDRDQVKWGFFISPSTAIPTMENPDCSECDLRANVLSDDTIIGLYEGAGYYHCGRYRPAYTCKMRSSSQEFCRVCVDGIAEKLREYIPDTPTVEVVPTLLEFGEVAHGLTMYRAFEVRNVRVGMPVSVEIDIGDIVGDPDFAFPAGVERSFRLPAPVFEPALSTLVFVAFTSEEDAVPVAFGSVPLSSPGATTGLPSTVSLQGTAVAPPPVDSVLVMDRSDSMSGASGVPGETKTETAIDAARLYVSLLKDNDRIGVVRYNDEARDPQDILLGLTLADGAGKSAANGVLTPASLSPAGFTSIGGGIILGSSVLDAGGSDARAIVVLTDGIQNRSPDVPAAQADVQTKSPTQRVFSVGFGLNQVAATLEQIASVTNGSAQITGDLVDQKEFLLQKLYVQILSDVSDEAFVKDPKGLAFPGQTQDTIVHLAEVDVSADFITVFRADQVFPKYMTVTLEAPDGTVIGAGEAASMGNVQLVRGQQHLYYRVLFPLFPDKPTAHVGAWKVRVSNETGRRPVHDDVGFGGVPLIYSVMAKARSDYRLGGRLEQADYGPGSAMAVILEPTLYGWPVSLIEPVEVTVERPDGSVRTLRLDPDANCLYRGNYDDTGQIGTYRITADVSARTGAGSFLTRHRQLTGLIFRPGSGGSGPGSTGPGGGPDVEDLIDVIKECCKRQHIGQEQMIALLKKLLER